MHGCIIFLMLNLWNVQVFKQLTEKYLKKHNMRDWLLVIASNRITFD